MNMKLRGFLPQFVFLSLLLSGVMAQAASITGTVTNKTNGKPSSGDTEIGRAHV